MYLVDKDVLHQVWSCEVTSVLQGTSFVIVFVTGTVIVVVRWIVPVCVAEVCFVVVTGGGR